MLGSTGRNESRGKPEPEARRDTLRTVLLRIRNQQVTGSSPVNGSSLERSEVTGNKDFIRFWLAHLRWDSSSFARLGWRNPRCDHILDGSLLCGGHRSW